MKPFLTALAKTLAFAGFLAACTMRNAEVQPDSEEPVPISESPALPGPVPRDAVAQAAPGQDEGPLAKDAIDPYAGRADKPSRPVPGSRSPISAKKGGSEAVDPYASRPRAMEDAEELDMAQSEHYPEPATPRSNHTVPSAPPSPIARPSKSAERRLSSEGMGYGDRRERDCMYAAEGCQPAPEPYPYRPHVPRQNTEEYAAIHENAFQDARSNPLSTFSIDVDGASYANTRRFLQENRLPPPDAVRIEEFINSFSYDYPKPGGSDPFSITTETAVTPWNPDTRLVLIGLQGRKIEERKLPPSNLVFLIDVSGSMDTPDKLPLLKDAFDMLVDRLRPQDRISIVVYAGAAGMVLPPTRGDDKESIRDALGRLEAGGSTAGGAGLMLAYQAARQSFIQGGNNRVILATDGDFNVGLSGDGELIRFIEAKRKTGVYLSVLGFGTGNYKDSKMEQIADKGNGNYFYIDGIHEARKVLVEKMAGTLHAIAKDVKLQIEFNPDAVRSYRLVGYENRLMAAEDFNDDAKDAGELGVGHSVTALYEVVPINPPRPRVDPLKYQGGNSGRRWGWGSRESASADELLTVKFRYKRPASSASKLLSRVLRNREATWRESSDNFRFAAAVAGFGLLLRESRYRGDLGYDQILTMARGAKGRDENGDRAEFVHLVGIAKLLGETQSYGMPE